MLLGEDHQLTALTPCNMTEAQRSLPVSYEPGSVIVFRNKTALFARNERLTVLGARDGFLKVQNASGFDLIFDPAKVADCFAVFDPRPIAVAKGDSLLLRSNGTAASGEKLINGERVEVDKVFKNGSIVLKDGRVIGADYGQYTHGYAFTTQSSQSKEVDWVLMAIDAQSAHEGASQETLYVGASRGIERCSIYTDNKKLVSQAFNESGDRQSAHEFIQAMQAAQANPNPQTHENKNTHAPAPATQPQPLSAIGVPAGIAGLNRPGMCQSPGGGVDSLNGAQPWHSLAGSPQTGLPQQGNIFLRPGTGDGFPDTALHGFGDEGFPPSLAR